jgi:hypothetical protein
LVLVQRSTETFEVIEGEQSSWEGIELIHLLETDLKIHGTVTT